MVANTEATHAVTLTIGRALVVEAGYPLALHAALRDRLTLPNPAYIEAERHGRSIGDLPPSLRYYDVRSDGALVIPRGAAELVYRACLALNLAPAWCDETHVAAPVYFDERVTLSAVQERAVGETVRRRMGVLEAPAGSGKTIMAMVLIARRRQPTLIIVHTRELATQAAQRAVTVLGLDPAEIGLVGDGQCRIGERLTIGLVQTLARGVPPELLEVGYFCPTHRKGKNSRRTCGLNYLLEKEAQKAEPGCTDAITGP